LFVGLRCSSLYYPVVFEEEFGAVTGEDQGFWWEGHEALLDDRLHLLEGETGLLGQAYVALEEGVAAEEDAVFGAVEREAAGGVAGGGDDGERTVGARGVYRGGAGRQGQRQVAVENLVEVFLGGVVVVLLGRGNGGRQTVGVVNPLRAPDVVEVAVGDKAVGQRDAVVGDVVGDALFLRFAPHSAVNDDAHAVGVVEDVGVFPKSVDHKTGDGVAGEPEDVV
jgi:hypothetical protein